jgi:glutamine---fructose-6-phosphate transaminase (isomerizing)
MLSGTTPPSTRTHMLDEIREQPAALRRTLATTTVPARRIAAEVSRRNVRLVMVAARGTSDHAAVYAQYLFQYLNRIPVALATPSLFTLYGSAPRLDGVLMVGISQSGEATDVVEVLRQARHRGALTLAVTNVVGSPLASAADEVLECDAGAEYSVAATKTYTTACAALAVLASSLPGGDRLKGTLESLPERVAAALQVEDEVARKVVRYVHAAECVVLGRAFQLSTAREMALKLEETCYLIATPFSTADFRHGPAALVERGLPIFLFGAPGPSVPDSRDLLRWLRAQGADCVVVSEDDSLLQLATTPISLDLPQVQRAAEGRASDDELVAPIAYIVPGQLFAHYLALERGLNPDTPRSLAKVTRTR